LPLRLVRVAVTTILRVTPLHTRLHTFGWLLRTVYYHGLHVYRTFGYTRGLHTTVAPHAFTPRILRFTRSRLRLRITAPPHTTHCYALHYTFYRLPVTLYRTHVPPHRCHAVLRLRYGWLRILPLPRLPHTHAVYCSLHTPFPFPDYRSLPAVTVYCCHTHAPHHARTLRFLPARLRLRYATVGYTPHAGYVYHVHCHTVYVVGYTDTACTYARFAVTTVATLRYATRYRWLGYGCYLQFCRFCGYGCYRRGLPAVYVHTHGLPYGCTHHLCARLQLPFYGYTHCGWLGLPTHVFTVAVYGSATGLRCRWLHVLHVGLRCVLPAVTLQFPPDCYLRLRFTLVTQVTLPRGFAVTHAFFLHGSVHVWFYTHVTDFFTFAFTLRLRVTTLPGPHALRLHTRTRLPHGSGSVTVTVTVYCVSFYCVYFVYHTFTVYGLRLFGCLTFCTTALHAHSGYTVVATACRGYTHTPHAATTGLPHCGYTTWLRTRVLPHTHTVLVALLHTLLPPQDTVIRLFRFTLRLYGYAGCFWLPFCISPALPLHTRLLPVTVRLLLQLFGYITRARLRVLRLPRCGLQFRLRLFAVPAHHTPTPFGFCSSGCWLRFYVLLLRTPRLRGSTRVARLDTVRLHTTHVYLHVRSAFYGCWIGYVPDYGWVRLVAFYRLHTLRCGYIHYVVLPTHALFTTHLPVYRLVVGSRILHTFTHAHLRYARFTRGLRCCARYLLQLGSAVLHTLQFYTVAHALLWLRCGYGCLRLHTRFTAYGSTLCHTAVGFPPHRLRLRTFTFPHLRFAHRAFWTLHTAVAVTVTRVGYRYGYCAFYVTHVTVTFPFGYTATLRFVHHTAPHPFTRLPHTFTADTLYVTVYPAHRLLPFAFTVDYAFRLRCVRLRCTLRLVRYVLPAVRLVCGLRLDAVWLFTTVTHARCTFYVTHGYTRLLVYSLPTFTHVTHVTHGCSGCCWFTFTFAFPVVRLTFTHVGLIGFVTFTWLFTVTLRAVYTHARCYGCWIVHRYTHCTVCGSGVRLFTFTVYGYVAFTRYLTHVLRYVLVYTPHVTAVTFVGSFYVWLPFALPVVYRTFGCSFYAFWLRLDYTLHALVYRYTRLRFRFTFTHVPVLHVRLHTRLRLRLRTHLPVYVYTRTRLLRSAVVYHVTLRLWFTFRTVTAVGSLTRVALHTTHTHVPAFPVTRLRLRLITFTVRYGWFGYGYGYTVTVTFTVTRLRYVLVHGCTHRTRSRRTHTVCGYVYHVLPRLRTFRLLRLVAARYGLVLVTRLPHVLRCTTHTFYVTFGLPHGFTCWFSLRFVTAPVRFPHGSVATCVLRLVAHHTFYTRLRCCVPFTCVAVAAPRLHRTFRFTLRFPRLRLLRLPAYVRLVPLRTVTGCLHAPHRSRYAVTRFTFTTRLHTVAVTGWLRSVTLPHARSVHVLRSLHRLVYTLVPYAFTLVLVRSVFGSTVIPRLQLLYGCRIHILVRGCGLVTFTCAVTALHTVTTRSTAHTPAHAVYRSYLTTFWLHTDFTFHVGLVLHTARLRSSVTLRTHTALHTLRFAVTHTVVYTHAVWFTRSTLRVGLLYVYWLRYVTRLPPHVYIYTFYALPVTHYTAFGFCVVLRCTPPLRCVTLHIRAAPFTRTFTVCTRTRLRFCGCTCGCYHGSFAHYRRTVAVVTALRLRTRFGYGYHIVTRFDLPAFTFTVRTFVTWFGCHGSLRTVTLPRLRSAFTFTVTLPRFACLRFVTARCTRTVTRCYGYFTRVYVVTVTLLHGWLLPLRTVTVTHRSRAVTGCTRYRLRTHTYTFTAHVTLFCVYRLDYVDYAFVHVPRLPADFGYVTHICSSGCCGYVGSYHGWFTRVLRSPAGWLHHTHVCRLPRFTRTPFCGSCRTRLRLRTLHGCTHTWVTYTHSSRLLPRLPVWLHFAFLHHTHVYVTFYVYTYAVTRLPVTYTWIRLRYCLFVTLDLRFTLPVTFGLRSLVDLVTTRWFLLHTVYVYAVCGLPHVYYVWLHVLRFGCYRLILRSPHTARLHTHTRYGCSRVVHGLGSTHLVDLRYVYAVQLVGWFTAVTTRYLHYGYVYACTAFVTPRYHVYGYGYGCSRLLVGYVVTVTPPHTFTLRVTLVVYVYTLPFAITFGSGFVGWLVDYVYFGCHTFVTLHRARLRLYTFCCVYVLRFGYGYV